MSTDISASARRGGITGSQLKLIAAVTMLADHFGAGLIEMTVLGGPTFEHLEEILGTAWGRQWYVADFVLRTIGRVAFPIFCFLLVEGFFHTRDLKKYAGRLLIFALISEVPFDLAFLGAWFEPSHQNIYFTLLIGLLVMAGVKRYEDSAVKQILMTAAGCLAAEALRTDYGMAGVLLILILCLFRGRKKQQMLCGGLVALTESMGNFGAAALAFLPLWRYNGERGRSGKGFQYFFYWFYPAHILVIYVIRAVLIS